MAERMLERSAARGPDAARASGLAAVGATIWGPDRIDHAVLLLVPRGALPLLVAQA